MMVRTAERNGTGAGKAVALPVLSLAVLALAIAVLSGGAAPPPGPAPMLLTLVDPARVIEDDSDLLPDSVKAALRSYLGRRDDSAWVNVEHVDIAQLAGEPGALTASLNEAALPAEGDTAVVRVDVPGVGNREFLLTLTYTDIGPRHTYTGHTADRAMSIVFRRDTVVVGRITGSTGAFSFRSGGFGLLNILPDERPADRSAATPPLLGRTGALPRPDISRL